MHTSRKELSPLNFLLTRPEKNPSVTRDTGNQLSRSSHWLRQMESGNLSALPLLSKPLGNSCKAAIKGTKPMCALPVLVLNNHQGVSWDDGMKTSVTKTRIQTLHLEDKPGSRSYHRGSQMLIPRLTKRASPGIFLELCVDPSCPRLKMPWRR